MSQAQYAPATLPIPQFTGRSRAVHDPSPAAGVPEKGFTVYLATLEMDAWPILAQAVVPAESGTAPAGPRNE